MKMVKGFNVEKHHARGKRRLCFKKHKIEMLNQLSNDPAWQLVLDFERN
jgi:hypothetical protein